MGLASASGVRPFLPPLLVGALASADTGIDFDGSDYAFLESTAFLGALLALAVLAYVLDRSRGGREQAPGGSVSGAAAPWRDPLTLAVGSLAVAVGALLFAGSLAAGDVEQWPGFPAGAACALLALVAIGGLLERVRRRLEPGPAALVPIWADAAALALAGLAVAFPPAALAVLPLLVYLLIAARRSRNEKYEGLRILR